jgi:hypothetical protein
LIAGVEILFSGSAVRADWKDDVGYTQLVAELTAQGATIPTGSGVTVTQVEALQLQLDGSYAYRPDASYGEFIAPPVTKTFVQKTTSPTGISPHATEVGRFFYGNSTSIAAGVGTVNVWEADDWVNNGLNRIHPSAPVTESADVANFSWVGSYDDDSIDTKVLQRFDYSISNDDYVAVVGVGNGSSTTLPNLLCQSYNAISVGLTNGNHTHGYTTINGSGRIKPDIVAPYPYNKTSDGTAMVSSTAAMLMQTAKDMSSTNATHSETIKAVILAGATKAEFPWSHTQTQPLDSTYGAGELNVYNSYHILTGGEQEAGSTITNTGWDFSQSAAITSINFYYFNVAEGSMLEELSAVLTWNCLVTANSNWSTLTTTLANLDLSLWSFASGTWTKLDWSASTVDNVELLWLQGLDAGEYALGVSSDGAGTDYALAWNFTTVPEPGTLFMLASCAAAGLLALRSGRTRRVLRRWLSR